MFLILFSHSSELDFLKLGIPSLTASIPVKAVHPEEKAFRNNNKVKSPAACGTTYNCSGLSFNTNTLNTPVIIIIIIDNINKYVGIPNNLDESLIPLRFPNVINPITKIAINGWYGNKAGIADVIAAAPAQVLTATVNK